MELRLKKPKLICYDWDNTLVDTQPVTLASMNMLYEKYNLPKLTMLDVIKINGYCFSDVFTAQFGEDKSKLIQEEYQILYDYCAKDTLQPLPWAGETLKMFHDKGIKQCVMSNKPGNIVRREADKFNFTKYFDFIIGYTDSGYAKPDPKMFSPVYKKMEFKEKWHHPDKLWFFGDAEADVDFAKNINARLFFLGDCSLADDFPNDQLVLLNSHKDLHDIEFI
jgi:phosphoglycolate phosphatase